MACRVSGYGSDYNTNVTCPACGTQQDYTFDLNSLDVDKGGNLDNVSRNADGTFTTTLPKSKLSATFRLLNASDEKNLERFKAKNSNHRDRLITGTLRTMLVAIEDNSTSEALNYACEALPSMDSAHLRRCYREVNPDLNMSQFFQCAECEHSEEVTVPLTADFFWPNS